MILFFRQTLNLLNPWHAIHNLYKNWELIRILTWRDFRARFRGSFFGFTWAVLQPLMLMVIYTLVFSYFLKVRFENDESQFVFAIYLLCGLLPWTAFSDGLSTTSNLIRSNLNLVKRVVFPLEVLPVNTTLVALIQQVIGLVLLLALTIIVQGKLSLSLLLLPLVLSVEFLLLTGINWIWSSLAVFIPDLKQATGLLISVLMFVTPVFYPQDVIPPQFRFLLTMNPLAQIIDLYRQIILKGNMPDLPAFLGATIYCLALFLIGFYVFIKAKPKFADFV